MVSNLNQRMLELHMNQKNINTNHQQKLNETFTITTPEWVFYNGKLNAKKSGEIRKIISSPFMTLARR